jgi:hypothetical protein
MAIRFDCVCGHHLKARDEMAGRRTMCPACGSPVGVPSAQPTHRGAKPRLDGIVGRGSAPKPAQLMAENCVLSQSASVPGCQANHPPIGPVKTATNRATQRRDAIKAVRLVTIRERRQAKWRKPRFWNLETRWYHCLRYPLYELPMLLLLAMALAITTTITLLLLPRVLQAGWITGVLSPVLIPLAFWSFLLLLIAGHVCMFLSRVAAHAARGDVKHIGWPDLDPWPPLVSLGHWVACLLSGPALVVCGCVYYWLHAGALRPLDWLIMAELLLPATGYALVTVLLASQSDELAAASPLRVFIAIGRLGGFAFVSMALAGALLFANFYLGMVAVEQLHREWWLGALLLAGFWFSSLYSAAFLLRLVGLWHFRALRHRSLSSTPPLWAIPGMSLAGPFASTK